MKIHIDIASIGYMWPIFYIDNNNNDKTSIAPLSWKRIKFSGAPCTGIGQTHSPGTMLSS